MKKLTSLFFLSLVVMVSPGAQAQRSQTSPQETVKPAAENDVVRITTNLIQVDAVVTDKSGKVVPNLRPEDFELFVNGKQQQITNFSFITVEARPVEQPRAVTRNVAKSVTPVPPIPPVRLRAEQVQRTMALVVDDLTLSFKSVRLAKDALKKFVDEQMQPGDLVAIVRVGSGTGALQQFTSDKQHLNVAIEAIKYNVLVGRISGVEPIRNGIVPSIGCGNTATKKKGEAPGIVHFGGVDQMRDDLLANASLKATKFIIEGMRDLPGRKAVMFLSEGFKLVCEGNAEFNNRMRSTLQHLVDSANRSGVVIYTMDARGLQPVDLTAADDVNKDPTAQTISTGSTMSGQAIIDARVKRQHDIQDTQSGLRELAEQAGGFAVLDTNDLSGGIRKALDDQKSYYLIGYQPDASSFNPTKGRFNKLTVKVTEPSLKVRYRSGFFGIKDEDTRPVAVTPHQQVLKALTSPFTSAGIRLRLTPLYGNDAKSGSFVRSLVHISAKDLSFTDKSDGMHEAVINVVASTFGVNGSVADSIGETHTITLTDKLYQKALGSGLVYSLKLPVKNSGSYQLRVAVRDDKSENVGSASQLINVPDIRKDRLTISGIALSSSDPKEAKSGAVEAGHQATITSGDTTLTQAALRRFRTGHILQFAYAIYNAKVDGRTRQPQLTTQVRLYREGKEIYAGKETPFDTNGQLDLERLVAEGGLQLGGLQEGEYVLQIVATDTLARGNNRTTTNWIDFEVVK